MTKWVCQMSESKPKKNADLPVRIASAIVMLVIAGGALWVGGWVWIGFVSLIAVGVFYEWCQLAKAIAKSLFGFLLWLMGGAVYIAFGVVTLMALRVDFGLLFDPPAQDGLVELWAYPNVYAMWPALVLLVTVIAVDVGAYFAGRAIGGPKIAPKISPSKTWAGLFGGIALTWVVLIGLYWIFVTYIEFCDYAPLCEFSMARIFDLLVCAVIVGVVAQAGDFFESWMKRKADTKDSSNLLPGHGGLFDRVDGLLAVAFLFGIVRFMTTGSII